MSLAVNPEDLPMPVVFQHDPGIREGQITDLAQLQAGGVYARISPGSRRNENQAREYGPQLYVEKFILTSIGFRVLTQSGLRSRPEHVWVPDERYITGFGEGAGEGGAQGYTGGTFLNLSTQDLGIEPYMHSGRPLGWSVSYLRPFRPGETPSDPWEVFRLQNEEIPYHIPGTVALKSLLYPPSGQ